MLWMGFYELYCLRSWPVFGFSNFGRIGFIIEKVNFQQVGLTCVSKQFFHFLWIYTKFVQITPKSETVVFAQGDEIFEITS